MDSNSSNLPLRARDKLLQGRTAVLQWLRSPQGLLFNEWLREIQAREDSKLRKSKEWVDMVRAQGSSSILEDILDLEGDIVQYEKDLAAGRVVPIDGTQKEK